MRRFLMREPTERSPGFLAVVGEWMKTSAV